jgi:hypothetical protein
VEVLDEEHDQELNMRIRLIPSSFFTFAFIAAGW